MGYRGVQITTARAYRLGIAPATAQNRRRAARTLLRRGAATLGAVAQAWYGGDVAAAKAEIYASERRRRR